ncbi:hypothetical protein NKG94_43900 [Micromonospora sp. M12]
MAASNGHTMRQRGEIEILPCGSLRVKVYAGVDPISGKRPYLTEVIPAGRPRTRATLDQHLDRWLEVADIEATTRMVTCTSSTSTSARCWASCRSEDSTPRRWSRSTRACAAAATGRR